MELARPRLNPRHQTPPPRSVPARPAAAGANTRAGLPVRFAVRRSAGQAGAGSLGSTESIALSESELVAARAPIDATCRQVWLAFQLPGASRELHILADAQPDLSRARATRFRFRHVFPRDRALLSQFLDTWA